MHILMEANIWNMWYGSFQQMIKNILISSFATESSGKERIMGGMEEGGMTQHNDHQDADKSLETR